jgi:hypothetical protein
VARSTLEKGSNPPIFRISKKCTKTWKSTKNFGKSNQLQKHLSAGEEPSQSKGTHKLGSLRLLHIRSHNFCHWTANIECFKLKGILYVQCLPEHRSLKTTPRYMQIVDFPHLEEYICKAVQTLDEAKTLIESGFEYVTDLDSTKLFHKKKDNLSGVTVHAKGPVV